ncbi:hypothetical protein BUE80_DR000319 [Diplocarpon rosae]|nr:hypothetical protein BUE80_DR000319 [Diplocarpon rosae]
MFTPPPSAPGRGRSQESKVLSSPNSSISLADGQSPDPALIVGTDSPALRNEAVKAPVPIVRRPVGVGAGVKPSWPARTTSIASGSSTDSAPASDLSRSMSDNSTKDSLGGSDLEVGPAHILPPDNKDNQNQKASKKPQQANRSASNSISSPDNSPQRTEIWRRRSTRSDKSCTFSDLKLTKSNGSTASPPRGQEQSSEISQLSRSSSRKPVPFHANRPAPPQPEFMGSKASKLREKVSRGSVKDELSARHASPRPGPRPPTPIYLKTDNQKPPTPHVFSPDSPFTPPDDEPPIVPQKSEIREQSQSHDSGSDATIVAPTLGPAATLASLSKENFNPSHYDDSRNTSDTLDIASQPASIPYDQLQKPQATMRILSPDPSPTSPAPRTLSSPTSHAQYFPTIQSPAPRGFIFPGPELDIVHFDCYQDHKLMRKTNNYNCPVACMICKRKDTELRWRCMWCYLSACGPCMKVLHESGKDLRLCLERIGKQNSIEPTSRMQGME